MSGLDGMRYLGRKIPSMVAPSLMKKRAINPSVDDTVELSMKAPMSVSNPADLG